MSDYIDEDAMAELENLLDSESTSEVGTGQKSQSNGNLNLVLDIPVRVSVVLGKTRLPITDVLNIKKGSEFMLSEQTGNQVDVLVNQKLVARGEAVIVDEKFGVKITEVFHPFTKSPKSK